LPEGILWLTLGSANYPWPSFQTTLTELRLLLTMMLSMIEDFHRHAYPTTARYLRLLGQRHKARGVPQNLYPIFSQCLLETLKRFHGQNWSDQLGDAWRTAINEASQAMLEGYQ
jgi:hemoglobin-like flavoprotein